MNAKNLIIVLLSLFLINCSHTPALEPPSEAQEWHYLGKSMLGSVYYYNPQTIQCLAPNLVNVLVKVVPSEEENIYILLSTLVREGLIPFTEEIEKSKDIAYSHIVYEVDCMGETIMSISSRDFDQEGHTLFVCDNEKDILLCFMNFNRIDLSIDPETIWSQLFDMACKNCILTQNHW